MNADIEIAVAEKQEFPSAQAFYESRGYGGAPIVSSDFVVIAKRHGTIVGVGRLCQEQDLLWLRGMQVSPELQCQGIGGQILHRLDLEIGARWCCCLPYSHLIEFYRRARFEQVHSSLPSALSLRLSGYVARGLSVVAMVRSTGVTA